MKGWLWKSSASSWLSGHWLEWQSASMSFLDERRSEGTGEPTRWTIQSGPDEWRSRVSIHLARRDVDKKWGHCQRHSSSRTSCEGRIECQLTTAGTNERLHGGWRSKNHKKLSNYIKHVRQGLWGLNPFGLVKTQVLCYGCNPSCFLSVWKPGLENGFALKTRYDSRSLSLCLTFSCKALCLTTPLVSVAREKGLNLTVGILVGRLGWTLTIGYGLAR